MEEESKRIRGRKEKRKETEKEMGIEILLLLLLPRHCVFNRNSDPGRDESFIEKCFCVFYSNGCVVMSCRLISRNN